MKRLLLTTSIALFFLSSTAAFADGHGKHHKHHKHHRHAVAQAYQPRHDNGLHLGQQKQMFRRGERVPTIYLQPRYYVEDYRVYQLAPPPVGYRWVRPADGRYLLVQTATGLIEKLLGY